MATDVADSTAAASAETVSTELAVTGMTCGTCAARIQRKLGRLPGVEASVNYATGRARVTHPPELRAPEDPSADRRPGRDERSFRTPVRPLAFTRSVQSPSQPLRVCGAVMIG